jgi:hypothetical protein
MSKDHLGYIAAWTPSFLVRGMIRRFVGIASIAFCSLGSAAWAQTSEPQANVVHAESVKHAAHTKKAAKKDDDSEGWVIADPSSSGASTNPNSGLAEGRKKFFDQSTTLDNGGPANAGGAGGPPSASGSTGFTPTAGFRF